MSHTRSRISCCATWALVAFVALPLCAQTETPLNVMQVEEDWELVLLTPDSNTTAPQVVATMAPSQDFDSLYAAFEINHHSQPEFSPGGLQLQVWADEEPITAKNWNEDAAMYTSGETVTWTQSMHLTGHVLTFEITDGTSSTWGAFGGTGLLKASLNTSLENLNGYHPQVSVNNSGVGFASNRVARLVLKRVRLVLASGAVLEDSTERVVHSN